VQALLSCEKQPPTFVGGQKGYTGLCTGECKEHHAACIFFDIDFALMYSCGAFGLSQLVSEELA
jgi:hypothetical protein